MFTQKPPARLDNTASNFGNDRERNLLWRFAADVETGWRVDVFHTCFEIERPIFTQPRQ